MALDIVGACADAANNTNTQDFLRILTWLFAAYVGLDCILAAVVIRRKVKSD